MTLRRGFKAEAEREALRLRNDLGIGPLAPIDIDELADHLAITVVAGDTLIGREPFEELEALQVGVFSAATFDIDGRLIIVTNPLATEGRRRSDVAHELSHVLLSHELTEIRELAGVPFRSCRPEQEEEATALGSTILLPRPLLLAATRAGVTSPQSLATKHSVSLDMARYRLNSTGVLAQAARSRR